MSYSLMHLPLWIGFLSILWEFITEVVFWILKVVNMSWMGNVSLVKTTNLRFMQDILFMRVWDAIKSFLMGKTCDEHWNGVLGCFGKS
jgi:hypothetical protein